MRPTCRCDRNDAWSLYFPSVWVSDSESVWWNKRTARRVLSSSEILIQNEVGANFFQSFVDDAYANLAIRTTTFQPFSLKTLKSFHFQLFESVAIQSFVLQKVWLIIEPNTLVGFWPIGQYSWVAWSAAIDWQSRAIPDWYIRTVGRSLKAAHLNLIILIYLKWSSSDRGSLSLNLQIHIGQLRRIRIVFANSANSYWFAFANSPPSLDRFWLSAHIST